MKIKSDFPDCIIVHIVYTSKASSSFQNAIIASEELADIFLIDALNVTGGLTAIVMYAVNLLEKEPTIEPGSLVGKIESMVPKSRLASYTQLDLMKGLRRGWMNWQKKLVSKM